MSKRTEALGRFSHPVPISFFRVEFERKTSWVSGCVRRTLLPTNSTEARYQLSLLANRTQHINGCNVGNIMGDLKFCQVLTSEKVMAATKNTSVSPSPLGVYNSLGNALSIKVSQQINQVEILEKKGTILTDSLILLGIINRSSITGCVDRGF